MQGNTTTCQITLESITITENRLENALEKQNVRKLLHAYAIPAVINMIVMALYNIVDRIFIGQGAGALAISGLALTLPCVSLLTTIGTLCGVGATARISTAIAAKNIPLAQKVLGNAILLNFVVSTGLILFSMYYLNTILLAFGGSEQTIPYAHKYLLITIPGSLITNLNFTFCAGIRASGLPKKSMIIILTGVIINIILDPILIFGFGMGIEGAAIATVISMCISSVMLIIHFTNPEILLHFRLNTLSPDYKILLSIIGIGMAAFIMNITTGMVNIIMNRYLVNYGGDLAIGAYGIISCYIILIAMTLMGICQGMQPIISYNYSIGRKKRVKDTLRLAVRAGSLIVCGGFVVIEVLAPWLVQAFTTDPTLIALSTTGLRITSCLLPIVAFQIIATSFFQAINKSPKAIFMNISRQFIFLIPGLILFSRIWGLTGIWFAIPFADGMATLVTTIFFYFEKQLWYSKKSG